MTEPIRVQGLKKFRNQLRDLNAALPKGLRIAMNKAADIIVDDARPRVPSRTGRARRSVKARSTRTAVRVQGGSAKVPYYPWLDFGGRIGPGKSIQRPFLKEGRYIYRSYYDNRDEFVKVLTAALVEVAEGAGLEVTGGQ